MVNKWIEELGKRCQSIRQAILLDVITAFTVWLCGSVALGFVTYAAYIDLLPSYGPAVTSGIFAVAFGLMALAAFLVGLNRRRAVLSRSVLDQATDIVSEDLKRASKPALSMSMPNDAAEFFLTLSLAETFSPVERLAGAVIAGFIAGRNGRVRRKGDGSE